MNTFEEICDKLKRMDEISLLEVLDISSEELVERFKDLIENRLEYFQIDLEEDTSDDT